MKIAEGIQMLEIPANLMTGPGIVNPVLLRDENDVVLIDTGFPDQVLEFRGAFEKASVPFGMLSKIIITHSHTDHTGGIAGLLNASPQKISVLAHKEEKPYIEAELPPIRLKQMESQLKDLSGERRQQMEKQCENLRANYKNLKARVDRTVFDGEVLPLCGGITVIHTPGHTPGHICLYHNRSKTLVAGDALSAEGGELSHSPAHYCLDREQYLKSLQKLAGYDIETVLCYHGGLYRDNPKRRIAELAERT